MQHFTLPGRADHRGRLRRRLRVRRFVDPRVPGDPGIRHAPGARPQHRRHRPVPPAQDADPQLLREDPVTGEPYCRDPRHIAKQGRGIPQEHRHRRHRLLRPRGRVLHLRQRRAFGQNPVLRLPTRSIRSKACGTRCVEYELDGSPNLGYKPRTRAGYFPVPPMDHYQDLRSEMAATLEAAGHRPSSCITTRWPPAARPRSTCSFDTLLDMADNLMLYKYIIKNVAYKAGKTVTFMPKPLFQDNGSGMHCHQSLWKGGEPLFFDESGYAGLTDLARWYIGGLLSARRRHPGLRGAHDELLQAAWCRATRRRSTWSTRSATGRPRSASRSTRRAQGQAHRVPLPRPVVQPVPGVLRDADGRPRRDPEPDRAADSARQGPLRPPARGDGVRSRRSRARSTRPWLRSRPTTTSCSGGGVFTDDVIDTWITYKRENEVDAVRLRPHPYEFVLYYDI